MGSLSRTRLSNFTFTFHFHALEKEMATHPSVLAWRIPGTRGAWWAAVCGVTQSRTRLKRLSSSSSIDLISQVLMQYCSLHHQTLILPPDTTTGCHFHIGSASSFFLWPLLHSTPVIYCTPTNQGVHLSVSYLFAFSYCSWGSQGKNTEVVCHSLLLWTTFCQTSPP